MLVIFSLLYISFNNNGIHQYKCCINNNCTIINTTESNINKVCYTPVSRLDKTLTSNFLKYLNSTGNFTFIK